MNFNEFYWDSAGQCVFNVSINGTQVLKQLRCSRCCGGQNVAIAEQFTANINAQGQIVIQFTTVKDNAEVRGIEILTSTAHAVGGFHQSDGDGGLLQPDQPEKDSFGDCGSYLHGASQWNRRSSGLTGTTCTDTGLTASTTYSYTVEPVNPPAHRRSPTLPRLPRPLQTC